MNKKTKSISEPSAEIIKSMKEKFWNGMKVKLPRKEVIILLKKYEEATEAEKLFKNTLYSWPSLSEKETESFRKIYESEYGTKKKFSDYEMKEMAHRMTIIAMIQQQRKAGEAIRALLIKHKEVKITKEDKEKLKKLFQIAFDIRLTNDQVEYYLKLSYWFVWYEEGLSYNLPNALDNLLIHYDKKKRGKRGSLKPDDYDIGYFYRWINYITKELEKTEKMKPIIFKEFTLKQFIKWMDKEYSSVRSFLAGDKCKRNKDGTFEMNLSLCDWE